MCKLTVVETVWWKIQWAKISRHCLFQAFSYTTGKLRETGATSFFTQSHSRWHRSDTLLSLYRSSIVFKSLSRNVVQLGHYVVKTANTVNKRKIFIFVKDRKRKIEGLEYNRSDLPVSPVIVSRNLCWEHF
jgi:hypothetical protein